MTGWATAALAGPLILTQLRHSSYNDAILDLAGKVDPEIFQQKFGGGLDELQVLVDAKID